MHLGPAPQGAAGKRTQPQEVDLTLNMNMIVTTNDETVSTVKTLKTVKFILSGTHL